MPGFRDTYSAAGCCCFLGYTTSVSKNIGVDPSVILTGNSASVTLDAQSVTTLVSSP